MAIITLSRELGSLGTEIAETLSSRLGYPRLDKESLEVLLRELGMSEPRLVADDEKRPGLWEQLTREKIRYLDFMKAAMYRFAVDRDCIVVGRGGNIVFRGIPGTLKVRVTAPPRVRAARLRERLSIDEAHAVRLIHQSDHDRAGYHRYFFNAAWDCAADYDLVVNTEAISPSETCDMVAALLESPGFASAAGRARELLVDARIAQDVIVAIGYRDRVNVTALDVVCQKGVVSIHGIVRHPSVLDECTRIAAAVEGVTKVVNYMEVLEFAYYAGV